MKKLNIKSFFGGYEVIFQNKTFLSLDNNYFYIIDRQVFNSHRKKFSINKTLLISATENNKTYDKIGSIIKKLIKKGIKKDSTLVAIGGGIIQDITSFMASIIYRGLKWEFYPTTILAQGDSCIGSKTSINFADAKNQLGNFYPPKKIIINSKFINSLKRKDIFSGLGELAHYFLISGKADWLFYQKNLKKYLEKKKNVYLEKLIYKSLKIKKRFIEIDEFDRNERLILNYGHSFGHALEKITNHSMPHGLAVAHGMNIANYISMKLNYLSYREFKTIETTLQKLINLNQIKNIKLNQFFETLKKDKKNKLNTFRFILTRGVGKMFIKEINFNQNIYELINNYKTYVKKK